MRKVITLVFIFLVDAEPIQLSADCHVDVFCQAAEYNRQQLQEQRR